MIIRLLYFSTARPTVDRKVVEGIVAHAIEANGKHGITGALAFNGRNFCQVLEGEEPDVRRLVKVIEKDERHSGFKVLDEKAIVARHYPDFSMTLVDALDFSSVINAMHD